MSVTQAPAVAEAAWPGPTVPVGVGETAAADALQMASKLSTTEPFAEQIGFLLQHVGPRVVAASLGLKDPRQLTKWWQGDGRPKSPTMESRVFLLFQVSYAITSVFDGATAARFLRVRSPYLDYVAPGEVLRAGDPDQVGFDFLAAAAHFLAA